MEGSRLKMKYKQWHGTFMRKKDIPAVMPSSCHPKGSPTPHARRGKVIWYPQNWWTHWSLQTQKKPSIVCDLIFDGYFPSLREMASTLWQPYYRSRWGCLVKYLIVDLFFVNIFPRRWRTIQTAEWKIITLLFTRWPITTSIFNQTFLNCSHTNFLY